jgi:hypothetical protein
MNRNLRKDAPRIKGWTEAPDYSSR